MQYLIGRILSILNQQGKTLKRMDQLRYLFPKRVLIFVVLLRCHREILKLFCFPVRLVNLRQ